MTSIVPSKPPRPDSNNPAASPSLAATDSRLALFPVSFFAMVMGLTGWTIAWSKTETHLALPFHVSPYLLGFSATVFVVLILLYTAKILVCRPAVIQELRHPVKLNFFSTISIGLILLAIGTLHVAPDLSRWLWHVGAIVHLGFTFYIMGIWVNQTTYEITHLNPAWFIPVVGNILVPIAGVEHTSNEIAWFFFSIGLVFWIVLFTVIFYRVIFHHPLPERLVPTFFILIAPPAVGFISYIKLNDGLDHFARILYYCALFLTLLLATQFGKFARLRFFISWWAYSFPLAAMTIATWLMFEHTGMMEFKYLAVFLIAVLSLIVVGLTIRTLLAIVRREICIEEV
ncbi:MAG: SLAC1 anion channel family protein [Gammaproteobacteria bacterium]|nr:SLAC1 anion channel family protein [Gammaproteobacteria bacterium]MCP5426117.1 SLAC1 anion channel family protein [Gammaproteobacteria bacterium]